MRRRGDSMDLPRPFGPYTLLRRLAVGGMAEVYVAKTKGIGGFEKLVAIKVIHPRYSEDEHFVQMMVEEAKLSVLLTHVNIAQTFDLGCIDGTYFIVMELVDGPDAYKLLKRAAERRVQLPIDVCAYIAAEVCQGLDYAHRKRDVTGAPLHIVHRDISPQNVLISHAGEVKVVDFGIAKAAMRSGQTEVGVIKGKYYYMSPEQAWADPVDARSDIFSTGLVLHELLTGQMVYQEDNLPRLLDRVRKADVPPPSIQRPDVPSELDRIVQRSLAKHVVDRYESAADFAHDLMAFVQRVVPTFTSSRVAAVMADLFDDVRPEPLSSVEHRLPSDSASRPLTAPVTAGLSSPGLSTGGLAAMRKPQEYRPDPNKSVIFDLTSFEDESTSRQVPHRRTAPVPETTEDDEEDDLTVVQGRSAAVIPAPSADADEWDDATRTARGKLKDLLDEEGWGDETLIDQQSELVGRMREALERQVALRNAAKLAEPPAPPPP
ncbi:MAG: serine/threonine protein kinase, partial [Myxococcales bacterium]|nr:serine/threonine protein kinase [Myxococcales bacterium]